MGQPLDKDVSMSDSKVSKTYIRPDNTFVLTCPHCGHQKIISVDSFKAHHKELNIKCVCKNIFKVILEFRKNVRKNALLRGTYINHSQNGSKGKLIIQDISLSGIAFSCFEVKNFTVGDELSVKFNLEDEYQTEIEKEAIVRGVRLRTIGCEFKEYEKLSGSKLGYYVMNKL